jgi:pyruvate/2-oxoglutarate dehydrogenase complex dihydrolipoamide acyltransferase (E2) component
MAISVVMPALEMAQETGKLLAWRKKEGEAVKKGEPLLEIETDKAVVEIEAPGDGFLAGITAHEGAVIPVGETIGWLVAAGEKCQRRNRRRCRQRGLLALRPRQSVLLLRPAAQRLLWRQHKHLHKFRPRLGGSQKNWALIQVAYAEVGRMERSLLKMCKLRQT